MIDFGEIASGFNPASLVSGAGAGPFSGGHSGNTGGSVGGDSFFDGNADMAAAFFGKPSFDSYARPFGSGLNPRVSVPGIGMISKALLWGGALILTGLGFYFVGKKGGK